MPRRQPISLPCIAPWVRFLLFAAALDTLPFQPVSANLNTILCTRDMNICAREQRTAADVQLPQNGDSARLRGCWLALQLQRWLPHSPAPLQQQGCYPWRLSLCCHPRSFCIAKQNGWRSQKTRPLTRRKAADRDGHVRTSFVTALRHRALVAALVRGQMWSVWTSQRSDGRRNSHVEVSVFL